MNFLRSRQDLEYYVVEGYAKPTWVVRDPLTTRCYHLGAEEYFLLTHLNEARSLSDLQQQFESRFYPRQLSLKELQALLADWLFKELLQSDPLLAAQWKQAAGYPAARKPAFWKNLLGNPLMIRFRGWNPQTFLDRLAPWVGWIFTKPVLYGVLLLSLWAFSVAVVKWPEIQADLLQLPRLHGPATWLALLLGISFTKMLHELGHAVTCRHFGGRCTEMGLMLLVGMPCLYCNVTDAWTFRQRRERMLVSAAGILVDLTVASVCLLLWSASQPGLIAAVCLMLALLGSVNSLLLNGNPLMRYDGYYLCSDWTGQPNLRSRSFQQARQFFWQIFLGNKPTSSPEPMAAGLVGYGMLAGGYLWLVLGLILLSIYRGLQPWGAENLAVMAGLILIPTQLIQAGKRWYQEGVREYRERGRPVARLWTGNLILLMLAGLIVFIPFPRRIPAMGILLAGNSLPVVSQESGILRTSLLPGELLENQQLLFELENADLQREWARLQTAQLALEAREEAVLKKRTQLSDSTEVLTVVSEQKQALQSQQQRLQTRLQALAPTARQAGKFIPDPLAKIPASDPATAKTCSPVVSGTSKPVIRAP